MKILIFYEKHGDRYFDANTDESIHAAALKIIEERGEAGYYFDEVDLQAASIVESADGVRAWRFLLQRSKNRHLSYEGCEIVETESV